MLPVTLHLSDIRGKAPVKGHWSTYRAFKITDVGCVRCSCCSLACNIPMLLRVARSGWNLGSDQMMWGVPPAAHMPHLSGPQLTHTAA